MKASARAHHWYKLPVSSVYATVVDLANAEKVNPSYVARLAGLTLLGPRIVEAILDGRQPPGPRLEVLFKPSPLTGMSNIEPSGSQPEGKRFKSCSRN